MIKYSRKTIFAAIALIGIAIVFGAPLFASAQTVISAAIPGTYQNGSSTAPGAFVANIYQFALMIGGILAFGVVVYGGVRYMASAGNPSGQSEAKEWIYAALIGLLLLVGAYFVLDVVNPDLLELNLPTLSQLTQNGLSTIAGTGGGTPTPGATGCSGGTCQNLQDAGFACKAANQQPNKQASCSAAQGMVDTLTCIQNKVGSGNFIVTEAMPPTVPHQSSCHNNGCCVDTALTNPTCAQIQSLVNAAAACGATAANEYAGCAGSKIYPTTTGGNVHINSAKGGGC
jgi:hypothetical protein